MKLPSSFAHTAIARRFVCTSVSLLLVACSTAPTPNADNNAANYPDPNAGRYAQDTDSIPLRLPTDDEMLDPEPKVEPLSRGGNRPYNIYGVDYSPRLDVMNYSETGTASWYGNKFHGHLTSNGETYNVFSMTAAHKTLPLPSYVQVTNLENNRTAIVRVNDRGPFHSNRIIDLSYAAAYKLGIFPGGTGKVRVDLVASPGMDGVASLATAIERPADFAEVSKPTAFVEQPYRPSSAATGSAQVAAASQRPVASFIEPSTKPQPPVPATKPAVVATSAATKVASVSPSANSGCFIQLIASSDQGKLARLGNEARSLWSVPTAIEQANGLYRLLAGPLTGRDVQQLLGEIRQGAYPNAYITNKKLCG